MPEPPRRLLVVPRDQPELRRVVLQETRALLLEQLKRPRADGKPGWTLHDLGRRLGCTTQNVHHHLKILERHGLARVAAEEATHGLARQYWTTDVEHVYTDMAPDARAALAREKARAHHVQPPEDAGQDAYFRRHFDAMALLGQAVLPERQRDVVRFYQRESELFARHFRRMDLPLQEAAERCGVGEAKSALHFAAIAAMTEHEFEEWVHGLRSLRAAARTEVVVAGPRGP
ncbi:MAG: helix-turn-helix domain-containing protein [Halobacteriales archaeon]|nr:helix-turn-helix domain-containing protein [Halobacteriales archaeon]